MQTEHEGRVFAIERPEPALMKYYFLTTLLLGPFFFLALIPYYFRYHTLRYSFDREGIQMQWGILFRRQITLTYARIQDIHLTSNIFERWLGLARIQIQTASASSGAEMTLEGIHEFAMVRNYLYSRMRGVAGSTHPSNPAAHPESGDGVADALSEVTVALREVRGLLTTIINRKDS